MDADKYNADTNRRPRDASVTQAGELNVPNVYSGGPDTSATGVGGSEGGLDSNGLFGAGDAFGNGIQGQQDDFFGANGVRDPSVANGRGDTPAHGGVEGDVAPPTPAPSEGVNLSNVAENAGDEADTAGNKNKKPASKKAKKSLQPVRDKFTTLHAEEITRNREAYSDEMKKMTLAKNLERFEKGQKELVLDMMTALPLSGKLSAFGPCHSASIQCAF